MSNLPSQHPTLSLHLTDRALAPLISSARSAEQLQALSTLSQTALAAHESAQRLGLGIPQRIMVEHNSGSGPGSGIREGPVLLQTFLSPPHPHSHVHAAALTPSSALSPRPSSPQAQDGSNQHHNQNQKQQQQTSAAVAQLASLSISSRTNEQHSNISPQPHIQHRQSQHQHQGAIALAAESRSAAESGATTDSASNIYNDSYHAQPHPHPYYCTDPHHGHHAPYQSDHPTLYADPDETDNDEYDEEDPYAPPMLVGISIAPSVDEVREARRAAARLERVGREIQAHWAELQQGQDQDQNLDRGLSQAPAPSG
jgi:hypothetical protein